MNIGIILDGVLTNLEQFQFDYGSKFYFEKEMGLKNPRAYSVQDIYRKHGNSLNHIQDERSFWDVYYEFYLRNIPPRPFAAEIIKKLHEHGFQITIFCTRMFPVQILEIEKIKRMTRLWLIQHGIYFDFLVFSDIINVDLIQKYHVDMMLDHHPKTVFQISFVIPVVVFHAKYNEIIRGENIYRVYSWYHFYEKLDEILETEQVRFY